MVKRVIYLILVLVFILLLIIVLIPWLNRTKNAEALPAPTGSIITKDKISADLPRVSVVASGLEVPWALAFLPDNSLLVTERPGRVRLITNDGKLLAKPLLSLPVVQKIQGEGGLHGIVPHPNFTENNYIYLYYTYENTGTGSLNRVSRFTFEKNTLVDETTIVDKIPGALFHDGGRIKFGPDDFLYITTGDAQEPSFAQDKNSLAGKILRVTDDGRPAPDNPFKTMIYSYGHRNPQGIAWDDTNKLWQTEHGRSNPSGYDEVNLILAGKNYGWPEIEGDETKTDMETPKSQSGQSLAWAPGGATFINNSFFFTGLRGQTLYEAIIQKDNVVSFKEHFAGEYGRLRDVITGPDGMLYMTTSNRDGRGIPAGNDDKILRINPDKL